MHFPVQCAACGSRVTPLTTKCRKCGAALTGDVKVYVDRSSLFRGILWATLLTLVMAAVILTLCLRR